MLVFKIFKYNNLNFAFLMILYRNSSIFLNAHMLKIDHNRVIRDRGGEQIKKEILPVTISI